MLDLSAAGLRLEYIKSNTVCGRFTIDKYRTDDWSKVTCFFCRRRQPGNISDPKVV